MAALKFWRRCIDVSQGKIIDYDDIIYMSKISKGVIINQIHH